MTSRDKGRDKICFLIGSLLGGTIAMCDQSPFFVMFVMFRDGFPSLTPRIEWFQTTSPS